MSCPPYTKATRRFQASFVCQTREPGRPVTRLSQPKREQHSGSLQTFSTSLRPNQREALGTPAKEVVPGGHRALSIRLTRAGRST